MRHFFSDTERLKIVAKNNLESGILQLKRWWSDKYNLPPNHSLFVEQTMAELTLEMYEDMFVQREKLREDLAEVLSTQDQSRLLESLNAINKALGEDTEVQDDLVDKWEKELEDGKIPDLDLR